MSKVVVDLRFKNFSPGQLYVALFRLINSVDVLLMHNTEVTPRVSQVMRPMPVTVSNSFLKGAVQISEGVKFHGMLVMLWF